MKTKIIAIFASLVCAVGFESCTKNGGNNTVTSGGGTGGTENLIVSAEHHGSLLDTCTVYIKYGMVDAPANGIYDDSARIAPPDTTVMLKGLKEGIYFLSATGFHPGWGPVIGGQSWTISTQNTTETLTLQLSTY